LRRTYELHEANEELAFQSKEKEKKATELMLANKELQAFAYVASHDLQEPLRKIQTFANRILEKEYAVLSGSGKDYFSRIQSAAARMQQLIVDLLAFSHLNTPEREFENADLNKIIDEVAGDLKEIIEEKNAILQVDHLCPADIIPFQFRQLIYNLISNALKFSTEGIPPHITVKSKIEKGSKLKRIRRSLQAGKISPEKSYCHISFSDNGIGFNPDYKDQIFEVFQRLHDRDEYAGTGIGLAIVKKIVERHDGLITAIGNPGQGATFNIYIPVR
jgi:signal transduction histidine kinase